MLSSLKLAAFCLAGVVLAPALGQEQTFKLYDQVVLPGGLPPDGGSGMLIRTNQSCGQTFVPNFTEVSFIDLYLGTHGGRFGAQEETIAVSLRDGSITGETLGQTDPVTVIYDGTGRFLVQEFDFSRSLSLVPGQTYVFQPLHLGGDDLVTVVMATDHMGSSDFYPQGQLIWHGQSGDGVDIWFREGVVVVPEPRTWALMLFAAAVLVVKRRWHRLGPRPDRPA
jgi:hypothetical protein